VTCELFFVVNLALQEIALLSQFEHENIVQYYGTDKVSCFYYAFACCSLLKLEVKV
jgi:hypothetical protein